MRYSTMKKRLKARKRAPTMKNYSISINLSSFKPKTLKSSILVMFWRRIMNSKITS